LPRPAAPLDLHSFPTRRSSDLHRTEQLVLESKGGHFRSAWKCPPYKFRLCCWFHNKAALHHHTRTPPTPHAKRGVWVGSGLLSQDRKSTRLNSSHVKISYAVFC